jgi:hypothetical protein
LGDQALGPVRALLATVGPERVAAAAGVFCFAGGMILLLASLGLSPRDLRLIYRDRRTYHFQFVARAWRRLAAVFNPGPSNPVRREPTFGLPPHSIAIDRMTAWRAEPSLDWEAPASGRGQFSLDGGVNIPEAARDPEFDGRTERESHAMARRFAPSRNEAPGTGASRFRLRRMPMPDSIRRRVAQSTGGPEGASPRTGRPREGAARRRPIWPGSVPEPTERDRLPASRSRPMTGDELYGRAVAIVCADRKATIEYLQQRLGIGYMRAADLIERMQQEGILGAPVRNGTRPILGRAPRSGVV